MKRDVMSVRLWLPRTEVVGVVVDAPEELVVRVRSLVRRPRCPDCGTPSGTVHDRRDDKVRDLEVSGRRVTLRWERRRMVCELCGRRFAEDHPAFEGSVTARLARRLVQDARAMTVNTAARRHGLSWKLVNALVVAYAGLVAGRRRRRRCRVLLVDGTSIRKRHRYVTVLAGGDTGEVLAMVPHRSEAALSGFLASQGHKILRGRADRRPSTSRRVGPAVMRGAVPTDDVVEVLVHHARFEQDGGGCRLGCGGAAVAGAA